MDRSTARSLIYSMLSFSYVYPDENVYGSIAAGEWIRGLREALRLLDDKAFDDFLCLLIPLDMSYYHYYLLSVYCYYNLGSYNMFQERLFQSGIDYFFVGVIL